MFKKKILIYIGTPLLSLIILTATVYAVSMAVSGGNRIANDGNAVKITANSICKTVKNNGTLGDIFVPTNSPNEWNLFISRAPSLGVGLGECCTPAFPLTQTLSCPTGQTGSGITQTRTSTCLAGATTPTTSGWTTPAGGNKCVPTCVPTSKTRSSAPYCSSFRTGGGTEINYYTCSNNVGSWGGWVPYTNTPCVPTCVSFLTSGYVPQSCAGNNVLGTLSSGNCQHWVKTFYSSRPGDWGWEPAPWGGHQVGDTFVCDKEVAGNIGRTVSGQVDVYLKCCINDKTYRPL